MPTARPIIVIMFTTKKLSGYACPMIAEAATARAMAMTARTIGIQAAPNVPNTTRRITTAMPIPKISPENRSSSEMRRKSSLMAAFPVIITSKPSTRSARWMTSSTFSMLALTWSKFPVMATPAIAVRRSADTKPGFPVV
jgi:hypothetical protein